jgi:2-polyprenyl-3-methyl-5-hydroxy-6-metoxy-1,4-benzoquinol methylase
VNNQLRKIIKSIIHKIMKISLDSACKEHNLLHLRSQLEDIVPDITDQYTTFKVEGNYLTKKVRSQHAFQILLAKRAISLLSDLKQKSPTFVDIGDSSGTHIQYLQALAGENNIRAVSIDIDPVAVQKVRSKGLESIQARAETLHQHPDFNGEADIFLSYEMIEHLLDPINFLYTMAVKSKCEYFVVTVPYLNRSRVGLHQIRNPDNLLKKPFNAESTHIFELSPTDWNLIFEFSGWKIVESMRYTQYPKYNPLTLTRFLWRRLDFDGFYGVILQKDDSFSKLYNNW